MFNPVLWLLNLQFGCRNVRHPLYQHQGLGFAPPLLWFSPLYRGEDIYVFTGLFENQVYYLECSSRPTERDEEAKHCCVHSKTKVFIEWDKP